MSLIRKLLVLCGNNVLEQTKKAPNLVVIGRYCRTERSSFLLQFSKHLPSYEYANFQDLDTRPPGRS